MRRSELTWALLVLAAPIHAQNLAITTNLPPGWSSQGCWNDDPGNRSLTGASFANSSNTQELCVSFCNNSNYNYAGVEYSKECYCGNALVGNAGTSAKPASDCSMACANNSSQACGAGGRMNLFWNGKAPPAPPKTNPGPPGWGSVGCYTDSANSRTLPNGMGVVGGAANMSVVGCTTACGNSGYKYAGVEYAAECYCGDQIGANGLAATDGCTYTCNGNMSEFCGGSNRINLYQFGLTSSSSSTTVRPSTTTLTTTTTSRSSTTTSTTTSRSSTAITSSTTTTTSRITTSTTSTSRLSTSPSTTLTTPTTTATSSRTTTTTSTAQGTTTRTSVSVAVSSSTTSRTSTRTTTTTASSSTATLTGMPSGWTYRGCWIDSPAGQRVFQNQQPDSNNMTIQSCSNICQQAGYKISGMEYSTQCFCGNQIVNNGTLAQSDSDCAMTCSGNQTQICGGPNRLSVYSNETIVALRSPSITRTVGNWTYKACYTDGDGQRAFDRQLILNANTPKSCLTQCSNFGYMTGAIEYGNECYCGDFSDLTSKGKTVRPDTECNIACPGSPEEICGGQNRLSVWTWTGTPLYTFSYPTGAAAGSYEYFVPGVVVPLITVPGKNGKITFVEKHGTSYFGNSTGAYELDPSLASNFGLAWREMGGIKTDVFCSAGLILPDKGARQINVGGWSGTDTYGIRFYTPDGRPGTNSTNQWEENFNEVALQSGRWYPSAMMMSNGSILVIGGQDGSNGNPVPSLEVLPRAGGTVYLDWLKRTDPNNLYPFLAVLPSGNIFASYYNEARILDPGSFATVQTLPNMPGCVDRTTGGRTYPLEGTAVLLPQYAPYSDPLTVLLCGGSPGVASTAIDNCVSIQPDRPAANWTLERMPSPRVMSCMAALPDGTYLIINGAHLGVAGFGLGDDPNLNAVLYDPSKPVGSRMSIMANTTIARLYHSEAVVMDDGRVLVSGSDPQDNGKHPEEMRVEVFNPPYITSGAARPSFTLASSDWAYGGSYTFTVSGAASNIRVSILGAVASTHGNSMGQRTIFPAVSCSGGSCRVTAPPNANVAPPGWFQMFVLSGPTPSVAQWVRIGGDPGSLGSWPNFPDFTRPGS